MWLLLLPKGAAPAPAGLGLSCLAFVGDFAFLSSYDVTDVTACDVMGECELTECEADCVVYFVCVVDGNGHDAM